MMTLDCVKKNNVYRIVKFDGNDKILQRFMELGFTCGQKVRLISTSLLKKVSLIEIRGYLLSIRTELLKRIVVE